MHPLWLHYCEKILQYWNRVSAQVSVKWPLTPLRKMIYEAASPPEYCPASPILISISTHYVVVICPNLHFKSCRTPSVCISDSHLRFLAAVENCPPPPPDPVKHRRESLRSFLWVQLLFGGKQEWFSCANVSQSAPSNHRPVSSRDRGLRHSLNNLAGLCHRALGSQPSKVMTEPRRPTSPPISLPLPLIYRSRCEADKTEGHAGGRGWGRGVG